VPSSHEASAELAQWLNEGKLASREHIVDGGVQAFIKVCVPKTSSMSCDMGILVNDAGEAIAPPDSAPPTQPN
jgi:hypothetical protein